MPSDIPLFYAESELVYVIAALIREALVEDCIPFQRVFVLGDTVYIDMPHHSFNVNPSSINKTYDIRDPEFVTIFKRRVVVLSQEWGHSGIS